MNLKKILVFIVIAQFCCTSLWFAGNAVMNDLIVNFNLSSDNLGYLTSSVQLGFIVGTLSFAIFNIADRFSPSKVFFVCAIIGGIMNFCIALDSNTLTSLLIFRFLTGFFLAGIYPIGMKIATDYFEKGLGTSLGFLVGALVLGTAFPHILKGNESLFLWSSVIYTTSVLAILGGLLIFFFVPNGPHRKPGKKLKFVPVILKTYMDMHPTTSYNIPYTSFGIIAIGSLACIIASYLAKTFGTKKIAYLALLASCICCLLSSFMFHTNSEIFFLSFLVFWGIVVIADSPLFSTLIAKNANPEIKGTALTIVNCIGFSITIFSILLLNKMVININPSKAYLILAIGPIFGLVSLMDKKSKN